MAHVRWPLKIKLPPTYNVEDLIDRDVRLLRSRGVLSSLLVLLEDPLVYRANRARVRDLATHRARRVIEHAAKIDLRELQRYVGKVHAALDLKRLPEGMRRVVERCHHLSSYNVRLSVVLVRRVEQDVDRALLLWLELKVRCVQRVGAGRLQFEGKREVNGVLQHELLGLRRDLDIRAIGVVEHDLASRWLQPWHDEVAPDVVLEDLCGVLVLPDLGFADQELGDLGGTEVR